MINVVNNAWYKNIRLFRYNDRVTIVGNCIPFVIGVICGIYRTNGDLDLVGIIP